MAISHIQYPYPQSSKSIGKTSPPLKSTFSGYRSEWIRPYAPVPLPNSCVTCLTCSDTSWKGSGCWHGGYQFFDRVAELPAAQLSFPIPMRSEESFRRLPAAEKSCSRAIISPNARKWCGRKPLVNRRPSIQRISETILPPGTPGVVILVSSSASGVGTGLGTGRPAPGSVRPARSILRQHIPYHWW